MMRIDAAASILGGHPKPTIEGHFQNRPILNITRDVDFDARANTLGQHEQCLERRKEAASYSLGTAGMVPAKDPEGHRGPPDHGGGLSASCRHPPATTGRLGKGSTDKTDQRGDPRLWRTVGGVHRGGNRHAATPPQWFGECL